MDGSRLPDRVNIDPASPHFWPDYRLLGVKINGQKRNGDVHEFCVSEGWAMVRTRNRWGYVTLGDKFVLEKIEGVIEPYVVAPIPRNDPDAFQRAEEKRARKAAKRLRIAGGTDYQPGMSS
jgi:hypothetical protein